MEVRFFKTSERQLLLDSIDRLWSHNHVYVRKLEVFDHLFLNTPYRAAFAGEDNYSYAGMWDDAKNVVGLYGIIPQEMNAFGKTYPSATFSTWIVDKETHQQIDGLDFYDFVERNFALRMRVCIGLSDVAYRIDHAMGWETIHDVPRWIAVNRMKETMEVLLPDESVRSYLPKLAPVKLSDAYHVRVDAWDRESWDDFYGSIIFSVG